MYANEEGDEGGGANAARELKEANTSDCFHCRFDFDTG